MSNILNHNRLPFKCKLSYKDYWDFHLHLGREYGTVVPGLQTECLSAYIDTSEDECVTENGLVSMSDYTYTECNSKGIEFSDFGLTGMDNGRVYFDKETITDEEFTELFKHTTLTIEENDCSFKVYQVNSDVGHHVYEDIDYVNEGCGRVAQLSGGFFQGFFRTGNGCDYSVLPSDIGNGLSLEFEICRKDWDDKEKVGSLNMNNPENKGIFFYIGTRAENKWVRYYGDLCDEETEPANTSTETSDGAPLDKPTSNPVESDNKFLTYTRTCGGHTVLDDKDGKSDPVVKIDIENTVLPDNPFLIYSRTCGGTTVLNDEEYFKEHAERYNIYSDLWRNALAFQITNDGKVGYKYLVKDCDAEEPDCSYKIESEFSNPGNAPYGEWLNIHVRILPCGTDRMRLMFYVNGRLVLYSKELPKLNLRELADASDKQEGVPFNISLGGGTQGLSETVYEDWREILHTYYQTGEWPLPTYPLEKEFGGTFIGYFKSFKFYSCSLNYEQINQNVNKEMEECNHTKMYCGTLIFNEKPSTVTMEEQAGLIPLLNEYTQDIAEITIRLLPDISKKYMRLVIACPSESRMYPYSVVDTMHGLPEDEFGGEDIVEQLTQTDLFIGETRYNVWHYTYATRPKYKDKIIVHLKKIDK